MYILFNNNLFIHTIIELAPGPPFNQIIKGVLAMSDKEFLLGKVDTF